MHDSANIVAVIGTGNMGAPMSINLALQGFDVRVFDIVRDKMNPLEDHGIKACASHREAIEDAAMILTMLPSGVEVREVIEEEVLGAADRDCVLIDSSTIDLGAAREIHQMSAEQGYRMLDAPVSGGTAGAAAGSLTFMVGGDKTVLAESTPYLNAMGAKVVHCGSAGMGQAAKMCNNMMLGIQMASVSEGFKLARAIGLSEQTLYEVSSNSSGNCFSLSAFNPIPGLLENTPANNGYQPGFSADLMLKDMGLALAAAAKAELPLDVAPIAAELYKEMSSQGNGGLDFSAIFALER